MREETRYRVTGSLFLLALAVICLPMLLDGAGLPARRLPDVAMQSSLPEVEPVTAQVPESDFIARVGELRTQVDDEGFLAGSGTRFGEPVLTPGEAAAAQDEPTVDAAPAAAAEAPAAGDRAPAAGHRAPDETGAAQDRTAAGREETPAARAETPPARAQTPAWAVQVASFARTGNAREFRARLRQDGYEAFISTARFEGQVLNRVAVGPLLDRQRAESLQNELSARYEVKARLMAFSN